jgi:flavin-dependent thymidylate synthase
MSDQIKVELQEHMGSDRAIAESAWTSSLTLGGKLKRSDEDVTRVVETLITQKHASPIESVVFKFWIKMPIQTDRQHMTHRIASHNGMSGRYRTMPTEWLEIPEDIKELLIRTNSTCLEKEYNKLCLEANNWYCKTLKYLKLVENAADLITNTEYKRLREFFRGVLPQNNMTERVTIMNLRSFANYQKLRNSEHAQAEIRTVAQLMLEAVEAANICPVAIKTLKANGWNI